MKQSIQRLLYLLLLWPALLQAELTIEVTKGVDDPVPIAIVPFATEDGLRASLDVAGLIQADLALSGEFRALSRKDMLSNPGVSSDVFFRDWRAVGVDYLLVGNLKAISEFKVQADFELLDVSTQKTLAAGSKVGPADDLRDVAHGISDIIYQKLTNVRGAFSTKLLYVSARRDKKTNVFSFRLMTSDIDGARERVLLNSDEPIMTPVWAPDGKRVAYVSFETGRPGIYIHDLITGQRQRVTNFPGINGAPSWSPDGSRLAICLSKDGSPDIYVLDIEKRTLQRVTRHFAIDTEPAWMPDGQSLIFTSDRGGRPQIYNLELSTGRVQRLTFEGRYNARGRVLPDGRGIVMVHRSKGNYQIALQDFQRGTFEILTDTALDESPSIAPNGSMLLYATSHRGRGVLAAVSLDGVVHYRLPSRFGDVREPAWSPFLQ